jgi:hypothetical protein
VANQFRSLEEKLQKKQEDWLAGVLDACVRSIKLDGYQPEVVISIPNDDIRTKIRYNFKGQIVRERVILRSKKQIRLLLEYWVKTSRWRTEEIQEALNEIKRR